LSFLIGLHQASQAIASGCASRVLVFSSEIGNYMRDFSEPESAVLLGDGAAAAVQTRTEPGESSAVHGGVFETHSSGADLTACLGGGTLHHPNDPNTTPAMNRFHMNGRAVFKMARKLVRPFIDRCLDQFAWNRDDVDVVVSHQASGPGVTLLEQLGGFRSEQIFRNLRLRGNCVAASIPLALAEAVDAGIVQRGQRVVLTGSGAGLSLGAVAITF
jgi:3-oxoacyl-[acyl-carrier-protein] synthase-3